VVATRRTLAVAAGAAVLVAAFAYWSRRPVPRADGPIILISIDTLRADRLPAYGYTGIRTPHIERLVADGIVFVQAYSQSPQTLPAHTSILTGRLPFAHGVRDNIGFSLKKDERMVQHAFRDAGWPTGGFVSAYVLRRQTGIGAGFDVYDDQLPPASADRPLGQVQRDGADTMAAATRWIDTQASPKFFLFVHLYEPHTPYAPPERFAASHPYDGEVQYADELVGALLDHLRRSGLYDRATIALVSDHGEGLGDHGEDEHGIFLYRETIHVPAIVKLAGSRGGGRRVAAPVQQIDLAPTLLDLAGIRWQGAQPAAGLQGRSLVAVLEGEDRELPEANLYAESLSPRYHFGWSELYALTDGRYRLIRAPRDELYDIRQDPREKRSVADDRPQVASAMRRALDAIIAGVEVTRPSAVSDEDRQKLAALGYVGTQSSAPLDLPGDRLPDPKDRVDVLQKYRGAAIAAGSGRLAEAARLYRELLQQEPDMIDAWLQLAEVSMRLGLMADAVAAYREAIQRSPRNPAALTGAAAALLRLRRLDEARAHAQLAVDVAPITAHEMLARIAIERGDAAEARREARLAQIADPSLPLPAFVEGLIHHRAGRFEAAVPHLLEARQAMSARTEQVPDVNYLAGDALARMERYSEAEKYFLAELSISPTHARARAGLAMLYRAMGRDADSDRTIADLIKYSPTRDGYELAARLWTMFGEPARAADARAKATRPPG
jgi:arylsulfatase A-like enzyme/tetratricopeptide (TPR) repeat protein